MPDPTFGYVTPENLALFTDRYELTMMQGYVETGHEPAATFSLFFRKLPPDRGYLVAAGLEQIIACVEDLTFGDRAIAHLEAQGFHEGFLDRLADFEFSGDLRAVPEGTPVFPNEPLVEVTAPIFEAQLLETLFINQVGFPSLVATKAARMRDVIDRAGDGQSLVDFGSRRAHGTDAGMKAARAAYVGGFDGTSNEAAAEAFGVPAYGTMAHSWIQSFPTEREAFEAFVDVYGEESILLVDTYDTREGTELAMDVAEERGVDVAGVRLDSGDLVELSKEASAILEAASIGADGAADGGPGVFVSSGVDEYFLAEFLAAGGVATGFGPGTSLTTSDDAPKLDAVYKLVAVQQDGALAPSMKLSAGKVTYPGEKSVRRIEEGGEYVRDVLGRRREGGPGRELLVDVYRDGDLVYDLPSLDEVRDRRDREVGRLP
ncbi:MAG TPA: nicotinate phosphoribosyltransferase, partial [Halobacteriales archaeon]|nr:nicotinate phosphoribosyltransferase [Halobacteriales archaeon]